MADDKADKVSRDFLTKRGFPARDHDAGHKEVCQLKKKKNLNSLIEKRKNLNSLFFFFLSFCRIWLNMLDL